MLYFFVCEENDFLSILSCYWIILPEYAVEGNYFQRLHDLPTLYLSIRTHVLVCLMVQTWLKTQLSCIVPASLDSLKMQSGRQSDLVSKF